MRYVVVKIFVSTLMIIFVSFKIYIPLFLCLIISFSQTKLKIKGTQDLPNSQFSG